MSRLDDLRRVAAGGAATVLVGWPEGLDAAAAAAEQAAALAALKREGGPPGQKVVVLADGDAAAEDGDAAAVALEALRGGGAGGLAGGGASGLYGAPEAELVVAHGERRLCQLMAQVRFCFWLRGKEVGAGDERHASTPITTPNTTAIHNNDDNHKTASQHATTKQTITKTQTALQPGLEHVLADLLEFEDDRAGAEFYVVALDADLAGEGFDRLASLGGEMVRLEG